VEQTKIRGKSQNKNIKNLQDRKSGKTHPEKGQMV
jgi:hypothetical protein